MKVVAVANQKGGVGKTTTSLNLSAALAMQGQRILIVDLDPQANCTSGLGISPPDDASVYQVLMGDASMNSRVLDTGRENLSLIPSEMDLAGLEIELAREDDHLTRLRGVLQGMKSDDVYDYCILDTPPSLGVLMTSALAAADEIIIPLQCEWFGLEGLAKIVHVIEQIQGSGANPELTLEGIVMTMFDGRTLLSRQVAQEVSHYFPEQMYETLIPRSVRIGEAPSHGKSILEHDPSGPGAVAYRDLGKEFLRRRGK